MTIYAGVFIEMDTLLKFIDLVGMAMITRNIHIIGLP
jgi:hypothetical protein